MRSTSDDDARPDDLTRTLVTTAYAHFCAEHALAPSGLVAKRFALEVTESDARTYHGLDSAALERLLTAAFGGPSRGT